MTRCAEAMRRTQLAPIAWTALVLCLSTALNAKAVDIGLLHCNDSSGRPKAPYTIGTPVTVNGVVTAGTGTYTSTYTDVWIQDPTGGMEIYNAGIPVTFTQGDSITVSGTIDQYRGNTEVKMTSWTVHAVGSEEPPALVLTCYQADHTYEGNNCEPNESRLVRINNVTYSGTWPTFSGPVTLTDSTGSCTMYIDGDTGVQNVPPPGGAFDVVGILKQFAGFSPPFNSGYELLPRAPEDILPYSGPQIIAGPVESEIQSDGVTITWTTDVPASSEVDYGLGLSYELGTIVDPALVTDHVITLTGLGAALIHHYRVRTTNENGTTQSGDRLFCTASGPEVSGEIRVFFNKSVDTSLALGVSAQGNVDLAVKLIERIDAAQHSIDICEYSFDLANVADALLAAQARGVLLRFVYDNRDTYQSQVQRLISNGVTVIDDAFGPVNNGSGLMHNKFWVFDHRGASPDGSDDWLWTGSHNVTNEGTYTDAQNVILIQDQALAAVYTAEFDEMWGSSTQTPDPNQSRFGVNKLDNTPKRFNVRGVPMKLYFSPSDEVIAAAIQEVIRADASLHFCILSYTRADLAIAMENNWNGIPGFLVHGVFDSAESGNNSSQWHNMNGSGSFPWNPPADVWLDAQTGSLHHKYLIVDANRATLEPVVITGSANWSNAANNDNDENLLVVQDFSVANQYYQEFAERYHIAGGSAYLAAGLEEAPGSSAAGAAPGASLWLYPNPTDDRLTIHYRLPESAEGEITLIGLDGRRRAVLYRGPLSSGGHELKLDLSTESRAPAGLYFLRLETEQSRISKPLLLLP